MTIQITFSNRLHIGCMSTIRMCDSLITSVFVSCQDEKIAASKTTIIQSGNGKTGRKEDSLLQFTTVAANTFTCPQ